jgi:hypothetical protein
VSGVRVFFPGTWHLKPGTCAKHLASQPAENEFQIFNQNVSQPDFFGFWSGREAGLHKQARERFGEPLGKRLNICRLDFLGLGIGNPGLKLSACTSHRQRGENRRPAEQHREPGGRQDDALKVGALQGSLKVFRSGNPVIWHQNLVTFAFCALTFAF